MRVMKGSVLQDLAIIPLANTEKNKHANKKLLRLQQTHVTALSLVSASKRA